MIRVHRIPHSTNVERVALACAHKRIEVEWVDHDARDRAAIRALSGQALVPVLEDGEEVVVDSTAILEWLERRHPDPPLYPRDAAAAAEVRIFVDWFNRVWKRAPNEIVAVRAAAEVDVARVAELGEEMGASLPVFEALLDGREHLLGDDFSAADCAAFPFLKYPVLGVPAGDTDPFHQVLVEFLPIGDAHSRLRVWVERVDAHPRS